MLWHHILALANELDGLRRDLAAAPECKAAIEAAMEDVKRRYQETFKEPKQ